MKKIILLLIISVLIFSCTTKVVRPKLTGIIVDEQGVPVDSCMVGETFTDKNGRFELSEITYKGFVSFFGTNPTFIYEEIIKSGYEKRVLSAKSGRGGVSTGSIWDMDTIRLRKINTDFSAIKLKDIWLAGITKNLDTVFLTKKNQEYDEGKIDFISNKCDTYSRGYYYLGIDNLPKNVFERHIELDLTAKILKVKRVLIYGNTITSEKTKYDTIYTQGKWKQEHKTISFHTNLPEINGVYNVVDFNYNSMQLVKK
ncbi:hypothetical protein SL053_002424 [Flavobacterium psychrophilum]|uniref:Hypothetical lipoprotein n=2 Tax=Flavobacterium psychrophilum TaxID=96345 RepID=A6H1J0_FLAPJ|nr:hypothetical protein [Flavobacterium psychrophilum]AIJ37089.1 hypothetical protein FPSM_00594 [Flavobacterium psychrophilum]AIN70986.1 hypothetical protein FPG101_02830 [Flavobacterium psychrophilum FPG101]EKT3975153.1 hypothetical protein [Flavobacterium psychrophilum]EKT4527438.1 hypothetical protein [Flavobacterium psychrophilum]EKT4535383.1 hypothetical protein [Flavobacterium psychrophilum]